jgi:tRNA-splicing ligase RtcB
MRIIHDPAVQLIPLKAWLDDIEPGALQQAINLARLPFAVHHVALMPDVHQGYGMPVGGVLATKGYVIPNAVGVDIGCGMQARRTSVRARWLTARHRTHDTVLKAVLNGIQRDVPSGNGPIGNRKTPQPWPASAMRELEAAIEGAPAALRAAWERAAYQLGTLGGGNHFVELQEDEDGFVWVMLHSGSRALGKHVCDHFNAIARQYDDPATGVASTAARKADLAYLPLDSDEGQAYVAWMHLCLRYAEENRQRMLDVAISHLFEAAQMNRPDEPFEITEAVDTHHNYATAERHFGEEALVHRKGAVRARAGEMVIIPGSMETGSYVARGLGNPESFQSCSHGAGRRLSRGAALRSRTAEQVIKSLRDKGIELAKRSHKDVAEEAGHAYKDVDDVIRHQSDLVEPVYKLKPIGVVKG